MKLIMVCFARDSGVTIEGRLFPTNGKSIFHQKILGCLIYNLTVRTGIKLFGTGSLKW